MSFDTALYLLPGLVIGLTVHEAAHAISAKWLGDRTAEKMGRISLNPLRHLSLYGTLALFFLGFGWGKPVIVNLYNFKKPKFYYLLSSLAGPVSNLLICGICLGILYLHPPERVFSFLTATFLINGMLAAINLVPVPPLDGSKIWPCLIPGMKPTISGKWSMVWVVVLIISLQTGGIDKVLGPVFNGMQRVLPEIEAFDRSSEIRPEGFPEELVPPENVTGVRYVSKWLGKQRASDNYYSVCFSVNNQQDGDVAYASVGQRLSETGWRRLRYDFYDPKIENDWELGETTLVGEPHRPLVQSDYWIKPPGLIIETNRFHLSFGDVNRGDMHLISAKYIDDLTDSMIKDLVAYRQLHPEEFDGIDIVKRQ